MTDPVNESMKVTQVINSLVFILVNLTFHKSHKSQHARSSPHLKVLVAEVLFQLGRVDSVWERPPLQLLPGVRRPAQLGQGRLQAAILDELK